MGSPCVFPDLHPLSSHDSESESNDNLTQQSLAPTPPCDNEANSDNWTPYNSQAKFELAELLYTCSQIPASEIDHLLNIWAATHVANGQDLLFKDHKNMYATINMTPLGDVAWENFEVQYSGELPNGDIPSRMTANHTVWFCNCHALVQHILSNPDFRDNFECSPLQEHDTEGNH